MKIKFIILPIVFLFLQSCVLTSLKKADRQFVFSKVLAEKDRAYIYRSKISLYDNDFSGMIIIKSNLKKHRIVFINEIGMKFFDFEFSGNTYKVNQIFEPLNKKIFIKLLINDFRFILMNNLNSDFKNYKKNNLFVIKPKQKKELFYFNSESKYPFKAIKYSLFKKTTYLRYNNLSDNIPKSISLKHNNIKFIINMEFLK